MANKNELEINRETVHKSSTVRSGNTSFTIERSNSGVSVTSRKNTLVIPNGAVGQAILAELGAMIGATSSGGS